MVDKFNAPLVYVWLGESLPNWAGESLQITKNLCGVETILLTNRGVDKCAYVDRHIYIEDFYLDNQSSSKILNYADKFRDGFWLKTLERFVVLEAFMGIYGFTKIFHAELDNIVFNIVDLAKRLDALGLGFFCPRDSVQRGIASLVYINDPSSMKCFKEIDLSLAGVEFNDMTFLGAKLQASAQFLSLPTENALELGVTNKWTFIAPEKVGGIFDAASLGQYVFGIDTRNTFFPKFNGFINENSGSSLKKLRFNISLNNGMSYLRDLNQNKDFRLFNIHVHSKIFSQIKHQNTFDLIVGNINKGKKTLIKRKFGYGG